jgi:ribosome maturation factor RimP
MDDSFHSNYRLDVSSPGIGHPLKYDFEYKKNIGHTLVVSEHGDNGTIVHEGVLMKFDIDILALSSEKGDVEIIRNNIEQAKVKVQW